MGQGTNVQTGPNGEVYVCWADYDVDGTNKVIYPSHGLGFCSSTNGGVSFAAYRRVLNYTGIRASSSPDPLFNQIGVNDFPSMAVDKSNGIHRGRIYVVLPIKENGNGKAVIGFTFSDNLGGTWSAPTTISIPTGRQNWFPWITVDDCSGDVWATYYSFDTPSGFTTNTYVTHSIDGGTTWETQRVSDVSHTTAPINDAIFRTGYAGDYIGIAAFGGRAYPIWMDNRNGTWQLYCSPVTSNLNSYSISGDNIFCTTSTNYTLTNLPTGATVQWQVTPANIATPNSPNATQTTLTKNNSGVAALIATISNVCGGPITVTKPNIIVGTPSTTITGPSSLCPCTCCNMYSTINIPGAAYSWTVTPSSGNSVSGTGNQAEVIITSPCTLKVEITTACGTISSTLHIFVKSPGQCNGGCSSPSYIIAPNPAHSSVNISVFSSEKNMKVKGLQSSSSENEKVFNGIKLVNIYNTSGKLNRQEQFSGNPSQVQIDISKLPIGVYVVEISDGKYKEQQKLVISR